MSDDYKMVPVIQAEDPQWEVRRRVFSPEPKFDVQRRISMGSETVARCWDIRWARKIMRLLAKDGELQRHNR